MPDARLERTRRAYVRVINMGPYGCKLSTDDPDHVQLNAIWNRMERETQLVMPTKSNKKRESI